MGEFKDEEDLYRFIPPTQWSAKDGRPSSAAFCDYELSVDWSKICSPLATKRRAIQVNSGVASFTVRLARALGQELKWDPLEGNKAHSLVVGHKRKSVSREFAKNCIMVIQCIVGNGVAKL